MIDRVERRGVVATRICPRCGHHEVGVKDAQGVFHPLKPGRRVLLLGEDEQTASGGREMAASRDLDTIPEEDCPSGLPPWAPPPLLERPSLRLVFGVFQDAASERMTAARYRAAYMEKLRRMIETEETGPLAVLLDRFFTVPHLASGPPGRIASRLWEELEEIRSPALLVGSWLEGDGGDLLPRALDLVPSGDESREPPPGRDAFRRELNSLSMETFFSLIT
ncbi:MAG: hypothetical protein K9M82_12680 [Deltaproteobacteria bacterium]|nr:hypothetical protein [Deltaproteobacteria bacterium]